MKMAVEIINAKFTVNGNQLSEMNWMERIFFNNYLSAEKNEDSIIK